MLLSTPPDIPRTTLPAVSSAVMSAMTWWDVALLNKVSGYEQNCFILIDLTQRATHRLGDASTIALVPGQTVGHLEPGLHSRAEEVAIRSHRRGVIE